MRDSWEKTMRNGYFRLVNYESGYGLKLYPAQDMGDELRVSEITEYLDGYGIAYDRNKLEMLVMEGEETVYYLGSEPCPNYPESYMLDISEDSMYATVRFIPPTEIGSRLTFDDFLRDLRLRNIVYGIQTGELQGHFQSAGLYGTDIVLARGKEPTPGVDASIEYYFNTETHRRPKVCEDGSVDYFTLTTINQCKKGDALARIIPEVPGIDGSDIYGNRIRAKEPKRITLKFGQNIGLSEDKRTIYTMVDGHVTLLEDKVFVSDVYAVKDVDVSTGNLDYQGSIQIDGNVSTNFEVKAGGNVIIEGLVEGAKIIAGGSITIGKGMNGAAGGMLKAGGDVMVKFLENARVVAGGFIHSGAILHSRVSAGTEIIVEGKRGLIVGGYVQAAKRIEAKSIGASMGATTILEVGVNPLIKTQFTRLQKSQADMVKTLQNAEVILTTFKEKLSKGVQFNESQLKYMKSVAALVEEKTAELKELDVRLEKLHKMMETQKQAEILVNNEMYPGTTIIIGDATKTIHTSYHYCKFVRDQGEVKMVAL